MSAARKPGEDYQKYRERRRAEAKAMKKKLRGKVVFVSRYGHSHKKERDGEV